MAPDPFGNLSSLLHLELRDNTISRLTPLLLANLKALKTLDLSDNSIRPWEERVFIDLPNLERTNLQNNQISDITPAMEEDFDAVLRWSLVKLPEQLDYMAQSRVVELWLLNNDVDDCQDCEFRKLRKKVQQPDPHHRETRGLQARGSMRSQRRLRSRRTTRQSLPLLGHIRTAGSAGTDHRRGHGSPTVQSPPPQVWECGRLRLPRLRLLQRAGCLDTPGTAAPARQLQALHPRAGLCGGGDDSEKHTALRRAKRSNPIPDFAQLPAEQVVHPRRG